MSTYATLAELQVRYGKPFASDEQAQQLLDDAESEVQLRVPDLAQRIADERVSLGVVERVVCEMVLAVLHNPMGVQSGATTKTVGQVSRVSSQTFGAITTGELRMTRHHLALLGVHGGGAFTVTPGRRLGGDW